MILSEKLLDEGRSFSPLCSASLAPTTFYQYEMHTREFISFLKIYKPTASSFVELDKWLCEFGTYLYDLNQRPGCLQHFRNALLVLIFFLPELKTQLGRSRQLENGWDRIVPSKSPEPLSLSTVNAYAHGLPHRVDSVNRLPLTLISMDS